MRWLRRLPQYEISSGHLVRGLGAALVSGAVLGIVWGTLLPFAAFFLFGLLLGLGLGYGVGEAVSAATNRKVGPPLQAIAAVGVVVAYLVRSAILASALRGIAITDIVTNDIFGYIVVTLGVFVAIGRVRR